jgi:hypothetical protein
VRLVRLGPETSQVGADVRAALTSWAPSDTVLGGIALLGVTPLGCHRPVEAIIVLPRGVVVVVGVDLPDPAVRLEAPLGARWKADGWPLVREDGAVNPGEEALAAAATVTAVLEAKRLEPIPVSTIVAVGPYVGQVVQSTGDLHQGVRVLHPDPRSMLTAARELAVADRPCSVDQARRLLTELVGNRVPMLLGEIAAEGFADAVTPDLATASTTVIPRITDRTPPPARPGLTTALGWWRRSPAGAAGRRLGLRTGRLRWLPMAGLGLLAVLLIAGVAVAMGTTGGSPPTAGASGRPSGPPPVTVGGVAFSPKGSTETADCGSHAYGDVQVWLGSHPCTDLVRSVYQTTSGGRAAAVALAEVTFADQATASAFAGVAGTDGAGGITDLVADGGTWSGGPKTFDDAAYTVTVRAAAVRLTEVVWIRGTSDPTDPALRQLATAAAGLPGKQ